MSKRKLSQGLQCITKFFKLSTDLDRNSPANEILSDSTERVPVEDKTLSESKKNNKASITVVNEIEVSGVIVGQEISDLDYVTDNTELEVDADTDMYPRFNNCGNPSQRGRLNQNYYNARQDERYRQSYENQRNFQYPRESYDRRDIPFNQHPNTNRNHYENYQKNYQGDDRRCYDDYHEQDSFTRPPIHNRRYNEGEVFLSDHRQYENTNFNRGRRRNQSQGNVGLPQHERVQRSFSSEAAGNRRDFQKSDSYNSSENSKGQETSRNEPNENRQNDDGKGDQSCQKESTDKNNVNNQNLSPRPVVNKNSVPCVFSPGSNIYQSDQYFSAADKLQDGEGKSNVKTTPSKNLKRHMSDIMGNHSESKGVQKGKSPVRRQESAPVGASKEKTPTKMDKMDFSSIKKALNEVKSIDDTCMKGKEEINQNTSEGQTNNSPTQNKTIDNKMESSPIERKRSVDIVKEKISSVQEVIPSSPLQRKNSKEKVNGGKAQSSPRSRNSSGDSQGMLSPKTDAKQRSAFQVVLQREDRSSETSKMSPKDNPSSPLDRKRSSSGDLKQFGIQNPDIKVIDSTYNAISEEEGSLSGSPDKSGISLKSALSYPEWKRLKAQKDLELQKEREKNRKCIELANTPEEYRKLLKLQEKKAREKEKSRKISETETEKKYVENNEKAVNSDEEIESSQLPTLHNSQNSFQAIQDNVGSDEDIDLEESDDDDLEAPSFLFSLEEASNRPIPRTPTKITHLESPGPCSPAPEADLTDITTKTLLSSKFSLDQLVSEKVDKSEDQREYEEMHAKLEEGLKKGGFVKDTLETVEPQEDEILPEHEKHLQEFNILDSVISEVHPGDVIFQPLLHQSRFTGSLSLQTCGYTPGASFIDKYLSTLQPKDYSLLLTSNILQNTLESVACQEAVLRWLFLLMSVHSNQLVTQGCHKTLLEHLNRQIHFKQLPQTWIPPIPDVLSVFCNYGCEVSRLLPDSIADSTEEEYSSHIVHEEQNGMIPRGGNSICRNLHLVLNIIGQCLHSRPRYSSKQLTDLLIILCHVAMDKSHNSEVLPHEFQVCLKGILKSYSSNYWESHCNELCHTLFKITGHHHNRQYLAQLLPEDKRGAYLQRRLAYLYLQDMFDVGRDMDIKDYKIKCLHVYLTKLQNLVPTDVYKLSSAISYLDIAVGNSAIKVAEKEDLQYLCDQLKKISGDVKDSVQMLDRSWVKDMMVRVCSKWTLYLLTVGSKQKSMFAYTKKKTPAVFEIKTVEASQGDISSQSEGEEESKDVPKDIIEDNRTPIITDIQCVDENSNQSQSKTFTLENENCENEIDKEVEKTVIIKIEKPDIIPISDSPMEVDLTEDDLPDLLDHS
ncbi:SMC5-SMC6 complex localization factor protein 2-like isoform X2 [Mytilus edulis]|uniref:SMC5-SMC6 complex localization factor protein 2-like isoform X2 n=1 Tax=Mytilus edulis TaxID=6550 RepID=UPI0039EF4C63